MGAVALRALAPGLPGYSLTGLSQGLVLVLVAAVTVIGIVAALKWWGLAGFTPPGAWRDLKLYWLPVALLFAPFGAGVRLPPGSAFVVLLIAYLATAVFEEVLWRGIVLGLLRARHPLSPRDHENAIRDEFETLRGTGSKLAALPVDLLGALAPTGQWPVCAGILD